MDGVPRAGALSERSEGRSIEQGPVLRPRAFRIGERPLLHLAARRHRPCEHIFRRVPHQPEGCGRPALDYFSKVAKLPKAVLYERLRDDIAVSGGRSLLASVPSAPQVLIVSTDARSERVRVYIWNLTYDRTRNDYKFQITGVAGGTLGIDYDARTVLLGYYQRTGVYLAADADHHRRLGGRSNAIQTSERALEAGYRDGIHAFRKSGTGETAIVVRNDLVGMYLLDCEAMHNMGETDTGLARLNRFGSLIGGPGVVPPGLTPRNKREATIQRTLRDRNFGERVLTAYGHRCCVCNIQLEMPVAAHIVEAAAALSSDDVRNGLALCPTHHRAYDDALIGIMPNYEIKVSPDRKMALTAESKAGGLLEFERGLRSKIHLPFDRANHPDRGFLKLGLASRKWR